MRIESIDKTRLARTDKELVDLAASESDWFVRSVEDVHQLRAEGGNVFAKLPQDDYDEFVAGLQFQNGGVAGGYYKPLLNTLNLPAIGEVFAHFGMSMELFLDDAQDSCQECACTGSGCTFDFWSFCSSLCGQVLPADTEVAR